MNSKKKVYVLLYDKFSDFEIVQTTLLLEKLDIIYVGFNTLMNRSITKLNVKADILVKDVDPTDVALFIIPGGEPKELIRNPKMGEKVNEFNILLQKLDKTKTKIAAICGGPTFLANSGILNDKKCTGSIAEDENEYFKNTLFQKVDLIQDGNILTAQGHVFSIFAVEIAKWMGVITTEDVEISTLNWLRNVN